MEKQIGKQSVRFENPPYIVSSAAIVGQKEGEGPYAKFFDEILGDEIQNILSLQHQTLIKWVS